MHAILLGIGGLQVYTYGTFIALGLLAGAWLARREARRLGIPERRISDIWLVGMLSALAASLLQDDLPSLPALLSRPHTGGTEAP